MDTNPERATSVAFIYKRDLSPCPSIDTLLEEPTSVSMLKFQTETLLYKIVAEAENVLKILKSFEFQYASLDSAWHYPTWILKETRAVIARVIRLTSMDREWVDVMSNDGDSELLHMMLYEERDLTYRPDTAALRVNLQRIKEIHVQIWTLDVAWENVKRQNTRDLGKAVRESISEAIDKEIESCQEIMTDWFNKKYIQTVSENIDSHSQKLMDDIGQFMQKLQVIEVGCPNNWAVLINMLKSNHDMTMKSDCEAMRKIHDDAFQEAVGGLGEKLAHVADESFYDLLASYDEKLESVEDSERKVALNLINKYLKITEAILKMLIEEVYPACGLIYMPEPPKNPSLNNDDDDNDLVEPKIP